MKAVRWIVSRVAVALVLGVVLGLLVYHVVVPTVASALARKELSLDHFEHEEGGEASGSEDAVYFAARYDCRNTVTLISGEAPDAVYWMIGIYDNRFQRIPGGHLNDATIEIDEDGHFKAIIQQGPGDAQNTLECGNKGTGIILMRVFLPADRDSIDAPTIEREAITRN
jgi:hypothetical protein